MRTLGQVKTEWSPKLAYVVGLIATDGSLSKDGRHIDITSKDKDLLATALDCLSLTTKITDKFNSGGSLSHRIQIGDKLFYQWLQGVGLHSNKSKTLDSLKVPRKLYRDFLRGCFDGDGSIWSYWDKRWANSYMFYLTFTGASPKFLRWMQKENKKLFGVSGHISHGAHCEQLKYAKKEARVLTNAMYYNDKVPHLARKRLRLVEILKEDPYP